jgi:tRNA (guanine26-N2/guanine27-N2)-dimethyltransferase
MNKQSVEGTTSFFTDSEEKISKGMPVFYNPVMKLNRDLTLAMLLTMPTDVRIGLPMEASGLRAARILHELVTPGHISPNFIAVNDLSPHAIDFAKKNIAHNIGSFDSAKVNVTVNDASQFLRSSPGFDYIDIDPFGTPNPFLDSAIQRISRTGILAVTATDTSALAGTYPAATARKYWSTPSRTWVMHEIGLRILIRKVQLIAAQYEKALLPVLSLATDHYYRIFFQVMPSIADVKKVLAEHTYSFVCTNCLTIMPGLWNQPLPCTHCSEMVYACGPLWGGRLHDVERIQMMRAQVKKLDEKTAAALDKLLTIVEDECRIPVIGFIDLHELASRLKVAAPRTEDVLEKLGSHACRTHINGAGVKVDLNMNEFLEKLQLLQPPR